MVDHIGDNIAETIPSHQRKAQPLNWDCVPAFNAYCIATPCSPTSHTLPADIAARCG